MQAELEQIRNQQKESWDRFSPGWKKWDETMKDFLKPMGDEMIKRLELKNDTLVLDIAAGTGEPGLSIASMLKNGKVIITDLSEGMLEVAKENAASKNITNFETKLCDVSELPFADDTFDAVSCRFGFMFFPDILLAAKEIVRVLKPGGRMATAVWHLPEKNFWVTAIGSTITRNMNTTPPPPGAPGMFRCAKSGLLAGLFAEAGLRNVSEIEVNGRLNCGSSDVYWNMMTDVAAPFVAALSKADDAMKEKIKSEVFQLVHEKFPEGSVAIDSSALVIYGEK